MVLAIPPAPSPLQRDLLGELLSAPAYPGEFESLLWVARCTYGELNAAQLSRLGSRGKAARALAPQLRQLLNLG